MNKATVAEAQSQLNAILRASEDSPVVITRNGKPAAIIIGVHDEEAERLLMAYSPRLQAIVEKSRKQIRNGEVLTHDEFWAEVEKSRTAKRRRKSKSASRRK